MNKKKKTIQKLLKQWQKTLYLQDWDIQIRYAPPHEMCELSRLAEIEYSIAAKEGVIRICYPNPNVSRIINQDMEMSIVHELLHLHYIAAQKNLEPDTAEHIMHEIAINQDRKSVV